MTVRELTSRVGWQHQASTHRQIVAQWTSGRLSRRAVGQKHPVDDFLFDYYPISPAKLATWFPAFDSALEAQPEDICEFNERFYEFANGAIQLREEWLADHEPKARYAVEFLSRVIAREAKVGCHALHEWAMVLSVDEVRHTDWQLRLSQTQISATIDELGLRCTHFDAFRFFTPTARPLNPLELTRESQIEFDQPGCLHANMDLYRIAFAHAPIVGSQVVRDAFTLAKDIRLVDMQVAPYDLVALGVHPIKVETATGRAEFEIKQAEFALRAQELRNVLITELNRAYSR